jgi:hypothetical protein
VKVVEGCPDARYPANRDGRKYTIYTAVAPDAVFTVRTYGTGPLYSPG